MSRRISILLLSALLTVGLTASVAMAEPAEDPQPDHGACDDTQNDACDKGRCDNDVKQNCAEEDKVKGKPHDPNAWGSVASQLGDAGIMGKHSSDPVPICLGEHNCRETPRDGLGNVAINDQGNEGTPDCFDPEGDGGCDTGDNISDHACIAAARPVPGTGFKPDCTAGPGRSPGPES